MRRSSDRRRKIRRFGLLGALGCLLGALLGEAYLHLLRPPASADRAICLVIDCSGSMRQGGKLREVQQVALDFVRRQDLVHNQLSVVAFASQAEVVAPLTHDRATLERAIEDLGRYFGSTRIDAGLDAGAEALAAAGGSRNLLLFTDGKSDEPPATQAAAETVRNEGIRLIAVATADADLRPEGELARMTGDPALVFEASSGQFARAFASAERAMAGPQLMESAGKQAGGPVYQSLRVAGWTACLALGLALMLVAAQNHHLGRPPLTLRQAGAVAGSSVVAGLLAGALGHFVFQAAAGSLPALVQPAQLVGWAILGALMGRGLALFVPNLPPLKATLGGLAGGVLGALGFVAATATFGDASGRLSGALVLGFLIGLMLALVDYLSTRPRLEVHRANARHTAMAHRFRW